MLSLSLSRLALAHTARARTLGAAAGFPAQSAWSATAVRAYSDDTSAGPSRVSYKKMQRRQIRESVAAGRTTEITDLGFLDAAPQRSDRDKSTGRGSAPDRAAGSSSATWRNKNTGEAQVERGQWNDGPRFRTRRDRDRYYAEKRAVEKSTGGFVKHQSAYDSSKKVKAWIERHPSPLSDKQVEEVLRMVEELPPRSVNAAVWNLVLALLGREKRYTRMWKAFNQMKKRGVQPSSRTYTTLLNAYAGISHAHVAAGQFTPLSRPEKLTLDRVRLIYEQSQKHIADVMRSAEPEVLDEDDGLAAPSWPGTKSAAEPEESSEAALNLNEVNVLPTNSYLKFLGRFGMWDEMKRVFVAMDHAGPLAPDTITYTTMLMAANNVATYRKANPEAADQLPEIDIGPVARAYWDQAVRQLCARDPTASYDATRRLDEGLALIALQCLAIGRPEDQRLVDKLIPRLWDLPSRTEPTVVSATGAGTGSKPAAPADLPAAYAALPRFTLNLRSATALMSLLSRTANRSMASHYTHFILDRKHLQPDWDLLALRAAVYVFSNARDVEGVRGVLESYQPPTGKDGWPVDIYHAALRAARWGADWDTAITFFRRMVHLPLGVELGKPPAPYVFKTPNGRKTDVRGKPWVEGNAHRADAVAMSTLLKAGVACGVKETRRAVNVFAHYEPADWWTVHQHTSTKKGVVSNHIAVDLLRAPDADVQLSASTRKNIADRVELAKDVGDAAERLLVAPKDDAERARLLKLKDTARAVVAHYGPAPKSQKRRERA